MPRPPSSPRIPPAKGSYGHENTRRSTVTSHLRTRLPNNYFFLTFLQKRVICGSFSVSRGFAVRGKTQTP